MRRIIVGLAVLVVVMGALLTAGAGPGSVMRCFGRPDNLGESDSGNNVLIGRIGRDVIHGRRGSDGILGLSGNDKLCGGRGDDRINGGDGFDRINGGRGYDVCNLGERVRRCEEF